MHVAIKLLILSVLALATAYPETGFAVPTRQAAAALQKQQFKEITLDSFVEQEKKAVGKGKRVMKMAAPVSFEARVKRHPEPRQLSYVHEVLNMSGVQPLPEVEHRMFVESKGGRIIPVYVEKQVAARIGNGLQEGKTARFSCYHLYSYSKGPAVLVVDFDNVK